MQCFRERNESKAGKRCVDWRDWNKENEKQKKYIEVEKGEEKYNLGRKKGIDQLSWREKSKHGVNNVWLNKGKERRNKIDKK